MARKQAQANGEHTLEKTLGLAMIMKDETSDLERILKDYGQYFDKIYLTVTDRPTYLKYRKVFPGKRSRTDDHVELSYFKWCDHFGKARAYNLAQVKTDYWMWMDLDDEIEGVEHIPDLVKRMQEQGLEVIWFHYNYSQNAQGESESMLWRERLVKISPEVRWKDVACHETLSFPAGTRMAQVPEVVIRHRKTAEQLRQSGIRNERLLEKDWQQTHSAHTAFHQGTLYITQQRYSEAIDKFWYAAYKGDTRSIQTHALISLCDCYLQAGQYDQALQAADQAIILNPDHPAPYYQRFTIFLARGVPQLAIEFAEIAMTKEVEPTSVMPQNPTIFTYKGPFAAAKVHLGLGNVDRAYEIYNQVKAIAPKYVEEDGIALGVDWQQEFETAYKRKTSAPEQTASAPAKTQ